MSPSFRWPETSQAIRRAASGLEDQAPAAAQRTEHHRGAGAEAADVDDVVQADRAVQHDISSAALPPHTGSAELTGVDEFLHHLSFIVDRLREGHRSRRTAADASTMEGESERATKVSNKTPLARSLNSLQ